MIGQDLLQRLNLGIEFGLLLLQWPLSYWICPVFKWSKVVWSPNGPLSKWDLNNRLRIHCLNGRNINTHQKHATSYVRSRTTDGWKKKHRSTNRQTDRQTLDLGGWMGGWAETKAGLRDCLAQSKNNLVVQTPAHRIAIRSQKYAVLTISLLLNFQIKFCRVSFWPFFRVCLKPSQCEVATRGPREEPREEPKHHNVMFEPREPREEPQEEPREEPWKHHNVTF
jgi:hypothetical protein